VGSRVFHVSFQRPGCFIMQPGTCKPNSKIILTAVAMAPLLTLLTLTLLASQRMKTAEVPFVDNLESDVDARMLKAGSMDCLTCERQCVLEGPKGSGMAYKVQVLGKGECEKQCANMNTDPDAIDARNEAFIKRFEATYDGQKCHCRDRKASVVFEGQLVFTRQDKTPLFSKPDSQALQQSGCTPKRCWLLYRDLSKAFYPIKTPRTAVWEADTTCPLCGRDTGLTCNTVTFAQNYSLQDVSNLMSFSTGVDQQLTKVITDYNLIIPESDGFKWVESPGCSKACADAEGPGMYLNPYTCMRSRAKIGPYEKVPYEECIKVGLPELRRQSEGCNDLPCNAAWSTGLPPEGGEEGWQPSTTNDEEGWEACEKSCVEEAPVFRRLAEDDPLSPRLPPGGNVRPDPWGDDDEWSDDGGDDDEGKKLVQHRPVHCFLEEGPGNWVHREQLHCLFLIPEVALPSQTRRCDPWPPLCKDTTTTTTITTTTTRTTTTRTVTTLSTSTGPTTTLTTIFWGPAEPPKPKPESPDGPTATVTSTSASPQDPGKKTDPSQIHPIREKHQSSLTTAVVGLSVVFSLGVTATSVYAYLFIV